MLSKIFTFLKEKNILKIVKNELTKLLLKNEDKIKNELIEIIDKDAVEAKDKLVDFVMNNIELPFPAKLFKGTIRKTIDKNFNKIVKHIKDKLEK